MIFEVHGPTPAYRIARYGTAEEAVREAASRVYVCERDKPRSVDRLEAGKQVTFTYGFSEVTIYVKGGS